MKRITPLLVVLSLQSLAQAQTTEFQILRTPGHQEVTNDDDLQTRAQPMSDSLKRALLRAKLDMTIGERLRFFEREATRLFRQAAQNPQELASRLVLNRSVDVVSNLVRWSDQNPELIAQSLVQFYTLNFQLALAYANNPTHSINENFPQAAVGISYATLLWKQQAGLTQETSKAILLLKIMQYLKLDLNSDTSRREYAFAYQDLNAIEEDSIYYQNIMQSLQGIKESLTQGQALKGVSSRDVVGLRSELERVLGPIMKLAK